MNSSSIAACSSGETDVKKSHFECTNNHSRLGDPSLSCSMVLKGTSIRADALTAPVALLSWHKSTQSLRMSFVGRIEPDSVLINERDIDIDLGFTDSSFATIRIERGSFLYRRPFSRKDFFSYGDLVLFRNLRSLELPDGVDVVEEYGLLFDEESTFDNLTRSKLTTTFDDVVEMPVDRSDSFFPKGPCILPEERSLRPPQQTLKEPSSPALRPRGSSPAAEDQASEPTQNSAASTSQDRTQSENGTQKRPSSATEAGKTKVHKRRLVRGAARSIDRDDV